MFAFMFAIAAHIMVVACNAFETKAAYFRLRAFVAFDALVNYSFLFLLYTKNNDCNINKTNLNPTFHHDAKFGKINGSRFIGIGLVEYVEQFLRTQIFAE